MKIYITLVVGLWITYAAADTVINIDNKWSGNVNAVVNNIVKKTGCGYKKALQAYQQQYAAYSVESIRASSCARGYSSSYSTAKSQYEREKAQKQRDCQQKQSQYQSCKSENARCEAQKRGSGFLTNSRPVFCFTRFCGSGCTFPGVSFFREPVFSCHGYRYCSVHHVSGRAWEVCIPPAFHYKKQDLTINITNTAEGDLNGIINNMISIAC